jgi:hypothetical protein
MGVAVFCGFPLIETMLTLFYNIQGGITSRRGNVKLLAGPSAITVFDCRLLILD